MRGKVRVCFDSVVRWSWPYWSKTTSWQKGLETVHGGGASCPDGSPEGLWLFWSAISQWTKSFENFFKSFAQLTLRLGLIRGLTSLIRKLDRVGKSPRADPDLHCGYHACADFLGLDSYHAASDSRDHFRTELL